MTKKTKKTSTNRSRRIFQSEGSAGKTFTNIDNDGDIPGRVPETINVAQHGGTMGENSELVEEELAKQKTEDEIKKEKIRLKEIEEAIINSTQKQSEAIARTFSEIMDGPIVEKPTKTKEGKK
jgi:CO dehydrogenase nickel-insertion accessory protein CooC1